MNEAVEEFFKQRLIKAQEDWDAVEILCSQDNPPAGIVCFHCQQCVEKLIKAVLVKNSVEFPKTHGISRLIELAENLVPSLKELSGIADSLTNHGVEVRYPGSLKELDRVDMEKIVHTAEKFREVILKTI